MLHSNAVQTNQRLPLLLGGTRNLRGSKRKSSRSPKWSNQAHACTFRFGSCPTRSFVRVSRLGPELPGRQADTGELPANNFKLSAAFKSRSILNPHFSHTYSRSDNARAALTVLRCDPDGTALRARCISPDMTEGMQAQWSLGLPSPLHLSCGWMAGAFVVQRGQEEGSMQGVAGLAQANRRPAPDANFWPNSREQTPADSRERLSFKADTSSSRSTPPVSSCGSSTIRACRSRKHSQTYC
jgi:hypothetical protein